jgi:hypothetical protein
MVSQVDGGEDESTDNWKENIEDEPFITVG